MPCIHWKLLSAGMYLHWNNHVLFFTKGSQEGFEDTKGVIRIRKSKDRQDNGQKKKNKRTNNDLKKTTQKTKDQATRTPLKIGSEIWCSGKVAVPAPLVAPVVLLQLQTRSYM